MKWRRLRERSKRFRPRKRSTRTSRHVPDVATPPRHIVTTKIIQVRRSPELIQLLRVTTTELVSDRNDIASEKEARFWRLGRAPEPPAPPLPSAPLACLPAPLGPRPYDVTTADPTPSLCIATFYAHFKQLKLSDLCSQSAGRRDPPLFPEGRNKINPPPLIPLFQIPQRTLAPKTVRFFSLIKVLISLNHEYR